MHTHYYRLLAVLLSVAFILFAQAQDIAPQPLNAEQRDTVDNAQLSTLEDQQPWDQRV